MKKANVKISVIIPVYNAEVYLQECLESLARQTMPLENFEIVAVHDCSPDQSLVVLESYAETYAGRMRIIEHTENRGAGGARNTGLRYACGQYITFLDPDDYIDVDTLRHCYNLLERKDADLCIYRNKHFVRGKVYSPPPENKSQGLFKKKDDIYTVEGSAEQRVATYPELLYATHMTNKIVKAELLRHAKPFPERQRYHEDAPVAIELIMAAQKIVITNEVCYYYRKDNPQQATQDTYTDLDSYKAHIKQNLYIEELIGKNKQTALAVQNYHINTWYQFLHNILMGRVPYGTGKQLFQATHKFTGNINLEPRTAEERLRQLPFKISQRQSYLFSRICYPVVFCMLKIRRSFLPKRFKSGCGR